MTTQDKQNPDREITYQVGWKKGKIHVQDKPGRKTPASDAAPIAAPITKREKAIQAIWKEAPYPNALFATLWMTVLPAAAFAAIVWLVSMLSNG